MVNYQNLLIFSQIFTKPKDEVSLILVGTDRTENELNEERGGYEHIYTAFFMAPADWNMIRYVQSIDPPNETIITDWLDGVVVAMEYLKSLR